MIQVIVVDDHPILADGIKSALSTETKIEIIGQASDRSQLLEKLKNNLPDIILMDVNLKRNSGLDLAKEIRSKYSDVKILFLSQFDDKWLIKKSLEVGAQGYLIKSISSEQLIFAINKAFEGKVDFFYMAGK